MVNKLCNTEREGSLAKHYYCIFVFKSIRILILTWGEGGGKKLSILALHNLLNMKY